MATMARSEGFDAELAEWDRTIRTVDSMLTLIGNVRCSKARDPLRALEDVLLDLRLSEP